MRTAPAVPLPEESSSQPANTSALSPNSPSGTGNPCIAPELPRSIGPRYSDNSPMSPSPLDPGATEGTAP